MDQSKPISLWALINLLQNQISSSICCHCCIFVITSDNNSILLRLRPLVNLFVVATCVYLFSFWLFSYINVKSFAFAHVSSSFFVVASRRFLFSIFGKIVTLLQVLCFNFVHFEGKLTFAIQRWICVNAFGLLLHSGSCYIFFLLSLSCP